MIPALTYEEQLDLRADNERLKLELANVKAMSSRYGDLLSEYKELLTDCKELSANNRAQWKRVEGETERLKGVISEIRTVTALPDVPLAELPGMIETLLSELADRQIICDLESEEERVCINDLMIFDGLGIVSGFPAGDPEDDEWEPEDTVVPAPEPSCRGCLRLTEIDGRLTCVESRSRMYGALLHWPGPGCVWAGAGEAIYGGGRG